MNYKKNIRTRNEKQNLSKISYYTWHKTRKC